MDLERVDEGILAIDPGREKCGLAVVDGNSVLMKMVINRQEIVSQVKAVLPSQGPVVIGDRTGSKEFVSELLLSMPHIHDRVVLIDEHRSSVEARERYWRFYPPTGWRRLIPVSMQVPPEPIDDLVAVILAERHIRAGSTK